MTCFTDNQERTWSLSVNVNTLRRVKALCGVMLTDLVVLEPGKKPTMELLERLANDPVLLVDVIYAAIKPEADARGISDESFGAAMVGDVLETAVTALLEEVIAFFPSAKRMVLKRLLDVSLRFTQQQRKELERLMETPNLESELLKVLEKA